MTLYEIPMEYMKLKDMVEDGEATAADIAGAAEELGGMLEEKLTAYAKVLAQVDGDSELLSSEIKRLQERKKEKEEKRKQLTEDMANAMTSMDKKKVETAMFSFLVKDTSESLVVDVPDDVPETFYDATPKLNKTRLKQYLKKGNFVDYAHLERGRSLTIK